MFGQGSPDHAAFAVSDHHHTHRADLALGTWPRWPGEVDDFGWLHLPTPAQIEPHQHLHVMELQLEQRDAHGAGRNTLSRLRELMSNTRQIQPHEEAVYIHGMLFCTNAAMDCVSELDQLVASKSEGIELLNKTQEIVTHLAAISRYLWPVQRHEWRGAQLRSAFGIEDSSPLKSRNIRNAVEHIDERIDNALDGGFTGVVYPSYVGPKPDSGGANELFFRAYFTDRNEFCILTETYDLDDVRDALHDLHSQLNNAASSGCRFPR